MQNIDFDSPKRLINRELSWLEFNARVLDEARNKNHPLFERIKFLAISDRNLDEFFMVRVAGIHRKLDAEINIPTKEGLTNLEQLNAIRKKTTRFLVEQVDVLHQLIDELKNEGIEIVKPEDLTSDEKCWLEKHFIEKIFPTITPLAIDPVHPFPVIPNDALSIVLKLFDRDTQRQQWSVISIPQNLERFIHLFGKDERLLPTESAVIIFLSKILHNFDVISSGFIHLIRDSEMEIDDDLEDVEELIESFKSALSKRKQGTVIRLIVNKDIDPDLIAFATEELHIRASDIFKMDGLLNLSDLEQISSKKMPQLKFVPFSPSMPAYLKDGDIFTATREKDILLHHPYESFDPVIDFLTQAAKDPNVVSIKQTLYRTSEDSPIVKALALAAEAGKSVTVMVELKARFDEEKNIKLAGVLEKSGAQVVFGFMKYKTHSKMILVTRKEEGQLRSYAHFGTGNYHPQTAKIYTDISVFTADPVLTRDAAKIFNYVTGYVRPDSLEKISISPLNLKTDLFSLIDIEIENAKDGKPAHIIAKLNALVDSDIIDKLYSASAAGVKVDLIVRGICCLKPGLKGLSENIKVRSIIGRFLEHSRIVCFANGSRIPSTRAKVFLSSADWMPRSFIRRVESMIPLEDPVIHKRILEEVIFYNLADNEQSWLLKSDGTYERMHVLSDKVNIHQTFLNLAKDANL